MLRRSVTLGSRSGLKTKVQSGQLTAISGETQEKRAALSQIRGLARRTCCAVGRGYSFKPAENATQHHGTFDSVNEDAGIYRCSRMRL